MRWILLSLTCISLTVQAGAGREALDHFLRDLDTLQADFDQVVFDQQNTRQSTESGSMKLKRPDRFRWDYQQPETRLILADGRNVWVAENDLQQITLYNQSAALKNSPASVLLAGESLEDSFHAIERGEYQGMTWLELKPHDPESDVEQVLLGFSDNQLLTLELTNQFGQITQFHFSAMQRNPKLADKTFVFEPPEGWDVFAH